MTKTLVTGSGGMLGKDIYKVFAGISNGDVYAIDLRRNNRIDDNRQFIGDLTDRKFAGDVLNTVAPDIIVHCAAITDLKICESNKELARKVHVDVTAYLAGYNPGKTKLIYISTDSVFDGTIGDYHEGDKTNPLNYYAKSKLEGERAAAGNANHIIIRTNIFGYNIPLRRSLAEWALKSFQNGESITGYSDVYFNAIYTGHLARCILKLIEIDYRGTINVASSSKLSKYRFLRYLGEKSGYPGITVNESSIDDGSPGVIRPKNTTLNVSLAYTLMSLPTIELGIDQLINDYFLEVTHEAH